MRMNRIETVSVLLWLGVIIQAVVPASINAQAVAEREQQITMDIQRSQFADSFETLLAGEREIVIVEQASNTPLTRGVAVLIGESGHGPFSQHNLTELATLLNDYGWVTMTMPAPTAVFFDKKPATEMADEGNNAEMEEKTVHPKSGLVAVDQKEFEQQEQQLMLQLQAIVPKTQQYPGFFLVIAQGTSAAWLSKIYSEKKLGLPDALVVVSPYWPERDYNMLLPQLISATEMPVLDVYSRWDNEWSHNTFLKRKVAAEKALKLHYRQRELIGQTLDTEQYKLLSKEIYGWLTHMGW